MQFSTEQAIVKFNAKSCAYGKHEANIKSERDRESTWFKVGGALVRELQGHVTVYTGYWGAIDKNTQAGLS